ncbi:MAG: IPTL-CTERM sorting domain-containing protein [Candidatus Bipolaricaulota bacterium]|nr:IPTL-CTERM sorting domain-containing protein [Candidatus Bipolaricaulota bacterium]MDW8031311.1 IPTL-CTERM sorting domain-containing protein [Candidatus Bipolaricaulota bacterium]
MFTPKREGMGMTRAPGCGKDCLLEGLASDKLPPSELYDDPEEFLNPKNGLFAICRGGLVCEWGSGPEHTCLEILGFGDRFGTVKLDDKELKLTPPAGANDILIVARAEWVIKEAWWTQNGQKLCDKQIEGLTGQRFKSIHAGVTKEAKVQVTITVVPTLTEWSLIALAVLLAGGMGYMLYRRRPALCPAAP